MAKELTNKQDAFVRGVVAGLELSDAYRAAFNCTNMTNKSINECASHLAAKPKVAQRIKELREKLDEDTIMSAKERLRWLTSVIKSGEELTADKLKAVDLMNKMQGEYVQKVEANVDTSYNIVVTLEDEDEDGDGV